MAYTDINTPVVEKITLPSGNSYYIADREIRDVVATISDTIAGGVSYIVAWDGASAPTVANIPAGVVVKYSGTNYTGTLSADSAQAGAFYLVKSSTTPTSEALDIYDEYVPVGDTGSKSWEKIGDTQVNLTDTVKNVTLNKQTDTVIGTDATFTITQPTIALATDSTSGTGKVQVVTGITSASASGDSVTALTGLGTPTTSNVLTGVKVTAQPSVTLTANTSSATGRITYVQAQGTATTTKLSASASGDSVTALTGLGTPSTQSAVKSVSPTTKKLATTTVTGVSGSTTPSVVQGRTSQTTATGAGTASTTNTDWLKSISVSNKVLTIGAATLNTQTTYSANAPGTITVPTAASAATTVATGSVTTTGSGADVVTDVAVGDTFSAVTGYASPTTDTVLGTGSAITIASGTDGDVTVATGISAATTRYLSASASGTAVGADGTAVAVTGYASPTTDTVLGTGSTISVTPTTTYIKGTASGANTAWNSKDSVTVLTNSTDVNVTKNS